MKTLRLFMVLLPVAVLLAGCPVGLDYPLGNHGQVKLDPRLIGNWAAESTDTPVIRVSLSDNGDNTYRVLVTETGEMYALETKELTGWLAERDGHIFLVLEDRSTTPSKYYHQHLVFGENGIAIEDVSLLVGGIDAVTSQQNLQEEISASMQKPECFTERYWYHRE